MKDLIAVRSPLRQSLIQTMIEGFPLISRCFWISLRVQQKDVTLRIDYPNFELNEIRRISGNTKFGRIEIDANQNANTGLNRELTSTSKEEFSEVGGLSNIIEQLQRLLVHPLLFPQVIRYLSISFLY